MMKEVKEIETMKVSHVKARLVKVRQSVDLSQVKGYKGVESPPPN